MHGSINKRTESSGYSVNAASLGSPWHSYDPGQNIAKAPSKLLSLPHYTGAREGG